MSLSTISYRLFRILALGSLLPCGGCISVPDSQLESKGNTLLNFPKQWTYGLNGSEETTYEGWVQSFQDLRLERLIDESLAHNQNLKQATARLKSARENLLQARAPRLPAFSSSLSTSAGQTQGSTASRGLGPWQGTESANANVNISWEVDLWGRLANLHQAARDDFEAATADYRGAELSVAANTAKAYFHVIAAKEQLLIARNTREAFLRNLRIVERFYVGGDVISATALDVQFARNNVAQAERALIARELELNEATRSLEILLGRYPSSTIEIQSSLPELNTPVPAGIPADLLLRRPDLFAAGAEFQATRQRTKAAWKNLLPRIVLSGRGSRASEQLSDLLSNPTSAVATMAASITQPLYQGGALASRARQQEAQLELAAASFAQSTLVAFKEVESNLNTEASLVSQGDFLKIELNQANLAEEQANRNYSEGLVGILSVLEAQRRAVNARIAMIALQNRQLQNRINLHLALGGDFMPATSKSPTPLKAPMNASRYPVFTNL